MSDSHDDDRRTSRLDELIDLLADLAGATSDPAIARGLLDASEVIDTYRILYGDPGARTDYRGLLRANSTAMARQAEPVPGPRKRRPVAVRRRIDS